MSNFKAELFQWVRFEKRVTRKRYEQLGEDDRRCAVYYTPIIYVEILPPVENPHLKELRKKLKKAKIKFTETIIVKDHVPFVRIEAVE